MGFFTKGNAADQELRAAQKALTAQCDEHGSKPMRGATLRENLRLQAAVAGAERNASRGERFRG